MWAAIVIIVIALLLVLMAPKPKIENARAANLGDFQFPRSKEGDPVPWFMGTVRLRSPNSLWYGDYTPVAIKKKQKTGMFSSKKVTVGYKYHIGLDLCWALGGSKPVTLRKLWSDKYVFWEGAINTAQTLSIAKPELFGGKEQRGGLAGRIDFYPGRFNEVRNTYLAQKSDPDVPAYIGQARTVFRGNMVVGFPVEDPEKYGITEGSGFYFGTTTNINAISAEMTRLSSEVSVAYSIMPNGLDVNPMELLYAGFTEKFGMPGLATSDIDLPSWQACAQKLYNEGFGMSLLVQQSITGKDLCEEVLRIADGILYQDTDSGKIVAKLIRNDYVLGDLPVLDQSIVKELVNLNKTTWEQTYNQCRVTFKDRANQYADRAATAQDFANINFQQRVKNIDISVPGCFVNDEANNLAVRQLSLLSVPLFQLELRCNRKASLMKPGDVFIFNWAPYGITNMVMRVQKIDKGTLTDGTVTINCVQDRFATALAVFAPPTGSGWVPVSSSASPVVTRLFFEPPKWFQQFFDVPPANDSRTVLYVAARPPGSASVNMDIEISPTPAFTNLTVAGEEYPYDGSFILQAAFPATDGRADGYSSTGFVAELIDVPTELVDQNGSFDPTGQWLILMNNEFMQPADLISNPDGSFQFRQVYRALLDTTFVDHAAGSRGWLIKQTDGLLPIHYEPTSTQYARIRDITPSDYLAADQALVDTITFAQRAARPAPPDYLTLGGSRTPPLMVSATSLTAAWRPRNRHSLSLVQYNASASTPEAAETYRVRWRIGSAGAWSEANTSSTSYDINITGLAGLLEVQVHAYRDGLYSYTGDWLTVQLQAADDVTGGLIVEFSYTGAEENYVVPAGYTSCTAYVMGGAGGAGVYSASGPLGGAGGYTKGTIAVTPGDTINIGVGQGGRGGVAATSGGLGGWPNGGSGSFGDTAGGGGGGRSYVKKNATTVLIAGGGGGTAGYTSGGSGGTGGGLTGQARGTSTGGTQSAGGTSPQGGVSNGSALQGGHADLGNRTVSTSNDCGGGGDGYYGGGTSTGDGVGSSGGSGFIDGSVTSGNTYTGNGGVRPVNWPGMFDGVPSGNEGNGTTSVASGTAPAGNNGKVWLQFLP